MKKGIIISLCVIVLIAAVCISGYKIMSEGGHRPFFYFNSLTVKAAYKDSIWSEEVQLTEDETEKLIGIMQTLKIGDRSHTFNYYKVAGQGIDGASPKVFRIKLITGKCIYAATNDFGAFIIDDVNFYDKADIPSDSLSKFDELWKSIHANDIKNQ